MSLFYRQNAAARFFVDQANGKVYEVVGGSAALLDPWGLIERKC